MLTGLKSTQIISGYTQTALFASLIQTDILTGLTQIEQTDILTGFTYRRTHWFDTDINSELVNTDNTTRRFDTDRNRHWFAIDLRQTEILTGLAQTEILHV